MGVAYLPQHTNRILHTKFVCIFRGLIQFMIKKTETIEESSRLLPKVLLACQMMKPRLYLNLRSTTLISLCPKTSPPLDVVNLVVLSTPTNKFCQKVFEVSLISSLHGFSSYPDTSHPSRVLFFPLSVRVLISFFVSVFLYSRTVSLFPFCRTTMTYIL